MITISLCMIVKNEESVLERCLNSCKDCVDEIIIVDTGSTDKTKEIASKFTNKVFDFTWIDDFSSARNFSINQATMDYFLWLDADDVIEDIDDFLRLKEELSSDVDVVMLKYITETNKDGKEGLFSFYRERIIKNDHSHFFEGIIHEAIPPKGKIEYKDVCIMHKPLKEKDGNRNLRIFTKMIQNRKLFTPREQFYYARELMEHARYNEAIPVFEYFIMQKQGWMENLIEGCKNLAYCYLQTQKEDEAFHSWMQSFRFAPPRAETCCEIGLFFLNRNEYKQSAFWYELALLCTKDEKSGAFIQHDCYDYIPYIQLCVCYFHLNEWEKSFQYNEKAGELKPMSNSYLFNKKFFEEKGFIS